MRPDAPESLALPAPATVIGARLRPSVRAALLATLLSRALVFALAFIVPRLPEDVGAHASLTDIATRGDAGWYLGIATGGYDPGPFSATARHNWAFFPLQPLLLRGVAWVTGEAPLTGIALSTTLLLVGRVLLFELALAVGLGEDAARRAVLYTALWPTAHFFSLPTTESLFLVLTAGCLLCAVRGAFWPAGLLGALASSARPNGILLLPALALLYFAREPRRLRVDALALLLVPAGLLAFMVYLRFRTGDALAFSHIQQTWNRHPRFFTDALYEYAAVGREVAVPWDFRILNFTVGVLGFAAAAFWAARRRWAFAVYGALALAMPLSMGSLQSVARYAMVCIPVPLALAVAVRRSRTHDAVLVALAAALALVTTLFVQGATFAAT